MEAGSWTWIWTEHRLVHLAYGIVPELTANYTMLGSNSLCYGILRLLSSFSSSSPPPASSHRLTRGNSGIGKGNGEES
ncbi:hypothetical protein I7I50_01204 [Histoplasma capsulatum G186AR]|uniref:Uncharacterized protein n=1 Tax=Ajellomyces capsulatus TaxID=5037 RepID=A0A8H7Z0B5_AJECA|nr:hypothetical protein I7I52_08969 [Histoplasma capsulatum]QSS73149.1 hypothetical protein I7I50_01204 [Histoplasma capsulatum G186AR]